MAAATAILIGNPYGSNPAEVRSHITEARLVEAGASKCGAPAWEFTVHVPPGGDSPEIDGYLSIDAGTGAMLCAGLPFLD